MWYCVLSGITDALSTHSSMSRESALPHTVSSALRKQERDSTGDRSECAGASMEGFRTWGFCSAWERWREQPVLVPE